MAAMGLLLIVWGLFKKAVIASELSVGLVDPVFFDPAAHSSLDLIAAAYGYAVQIYCDFSAYSDMAIGLAALLGYRFPHNFNQPYRARSLQDFWRRWHISLSSWLRDYLYIPLGGSRGGVLAGVPQPDDHDAARRAVARRQMDLPDLGRAARAGAGDRDAVAQADAESWPGLPAPIGDPDHLPHRHARLDLLPRRQLRRRDRLSAAGSAGATGPTR